MKTLIRTCVACMYLFFCKSYSQNIKSYLIIKASKYALANVVINTDAAISIAAGSSKIEQIEPGTYKIQITNSDGLKFDTVITVIEHEIILKKNPTQTSVRYLISAPEKRPSITVAKKPDENKKLFIATFIDNSKLTTKVDYLLAATTQILLNLEKSKTKLDQQITIVLKGDNEEISKRKTLVQIKGETTNLFRNTKSEVEKYTSEINTTIADYNTLTQELQKTKPDNDATKMLFQKTSDVQKNLIKLQGLLLETTKSLNRNETTVTSKLQGLTPMSESLEIALSHNRTDDYKFFVTPKTINNLKISSKNIINYLVDVKANYETFFYFMQQGLDVNDFSATLSSEKSIYATPILKACIAELDINILELLLKNGAKQTPTISFPDRKKANNQYLYNIIKNNNTILLLFIKYGFNFKQ